MMSAVLATALGTACDEPITVAPPEETPDGGCNGPEEVRHFEVFLVLDVSGSMTPFIRNVKAELEGFAAGFPTQDKLGRGVRVDFFVVGFVNDFKVFGNGRLSSQLAVEAALDEAISAGGSNHNLTNGTDNAEPEENMLDALNQVPGLSSSTDATKIVIIATDAAFVERPSILGPSFQVMNTFAEVRARLVALNPLVHSFTRGFQPGLNLPYHDVPALLDLPGSSNNELNEIEGVRDRVREKLNSIVQGAVCGTRA